MRSTELMSACPIVIEDCGTATQGKKKNVYTKLKVFSGMGKMVFF